jgi:ribosomal protein S18 acetylase RimI-like enzyme
MEKSYQPVPLDFRPARLEDAAAISALIRLSSHEFTIDPDGAGAEAFFESVSETAESRYLSDPRYRYLAAYDGAALAGFIALRDRCHLFHLSVAPAYQRQGLATRLWETAKTAVVGPDHDQVVTVHSTQSACPFYERLGFVKTGPPVHRDGITFIPMKLSTR